MARRGLRRRCGPVGRAGRQYFSIYRYPWLVQLEGALPDGFQPGAPDPTPRGARHPNGGGWVSAQAVVDASAYVGPHALVLGGRVSGNARIEDYAVVLDGTVSDEAVVGALTLVTGGLQVRGHARVKTVFRGPGSFDGGGQIIEGTAQLLGDAELRGRDLALRSGVYYGFVDERARDRRDQGSEQTQPMVEVTAPGPYHWRP